MNKSIKIFSIILIIFTSIYIYVSYSSPIASVALIQGKIIDKDTGQPVGTSFRFTSESGKKNQSQSTANDGSYQVVLNSGENYYLSIKEYVVVEPSSYFQIPPNSSYAEVTQNIYVRKVTPGVELFRFKAFEPNSKTLLEKARQTFIEVKNFMAMNPNINLKLIISSADSWFNGTTRKVAYIDKKGRKKTKTVKVSSQEMLTEFSKARYDEILKHFSELNIPTGHTIFVEDKSSSSRKKKGKAQVADIPNVKISVNKILDL
ncbi:MAG: hypothetical protein A2X61_05690 [Ignavibacteria bacterium GWB2_35_12]|nr:MAG: hypothetical protein A2X63_07065 [Ignavibacteria bacterium GWA2_35_8]OGU42246.1 MAG: hypothetical protein A2X61_05690 [Ignavibacteria bacterium GWB2_35_12]OGU92785.1 MAG: hypothetical protein A2220_09965 [Ignavibacteria bacterium RIFOXYA2_FULL_35_10]OGV20059.1 MAG: hypothetical protein A2475_04565 [Ignavibacteria bacterium RIFOXYC2_FULL_35_21]